MQIGKEEVYFFYCVWKRKTLKLEFNNNISFTRGRFLLICYWTLASPSHQFNPSGPLPDNPLFTAPLPSWISYSLFLKDVTFTRRILKVSSSAMHCQPLKFDDVPWFQRSCAYFSTNPEYHSEWTQLSCELKMAISQSLQKRWEIEHFFKEDCQYFKSISQTVSLKCKKESHQTILQSML